MKHLVTSLPLSKKLKKLGVKQESYFVWIKLKLWEKPELWTRENIYRTIINKKIIDFEYSAFTVAELGEMLPASVKSSKALSISKGWFCHLDNNEENFDFIKTKRKEILEGTEANARAKMLIYLIENKLLKEKGDFMKKDTKCKHCKNGCKRCDARKVSQVIKTKQS